MKILVAGVLAIVLSGCAALSYEPVREVGFDQLATAGGCGDRGEQLIVTARVSRAFENTLVLWDGTDPERTLPVTLPGRGVLERVRGWFGTSKHEAAQAQLRELAQERAPVTVNLVCQGPNVAPVARNITYRGEEGGRVAIAF